MAGFILLFYFFGVLTSQTEIPLSLNGMLTKLSGESAFALMSLLGANIMPHNFYLHSSFVLVFFFSFLLAPCPFLPLWFYLVFIILQRIFLLKLFELMHLFLSDIAKRQNRLILLIAFGEIKFTIWVHFWYWISESTPLGWPGIWCQWKGYLISG